MEIRLLRYFAAVVDEGTVSRAASRLHMTQPALSRQIKQLEKQIGVTLFRRSGARLVLTAAGHEFLRVAQDLLQRVDRAERVAAHLAEGRLSSLSIAAPNTTLVDIVAPFIAAFGAEDPEPSVTSVEIEPDLTRVLSGSDLAITVQRPPHGLSGLALARLPVWAYVRADHPCAGGEHIETGELTAHALVLPNTDFAARRLLDASFRAEGLHPGAVTETFNGEIAQALAAAGRGVAVVTDDPRFGLLPKRVLAGGRPLELSLHAVWPRDHHAWDAVHRMALRLRDFCRERYGNTLAGRA